MREIGYDKYTEYIDDNHIYYHVYSKYMFISCTFYLKFFTNSLTLISFLTPSLTGGCTIKDLMKKWREKYFLAEKFGNFKNYN
jgi:hypothetical protein